jgi:hypothetical protein
LSGNEAIVSLVKVPILMYATRRTPLPASRWRSLKLANAAGMIARLDWASRHRTDVGFMPAAG